MKKKIVYIVLILIFIGILVLANILLKQQNSVVVLENSVNDLAEEKVIDEESVIDKITNENFEDIVLKSEKTVLIDFYAEWCTPCKMLSPIVEQVAKENEAIKVVKINVDELRDIAEKYSVISMPTLVVIKNGQEINRSIGLVSKSAILDLLKYFPFSEFF